MKLAIIGSGATGIYLLKYLSECGNCGLSEIHIFDKESLMGVGMPYNPKYTDKHHLANITSEEIPMLHISFADWLRLQSAEILQDLGIERDEINEKEVYSRLALGRYFHDQYTKFLNDLESKSITIIQHPGTRVIDIADDEKQNSATLYTSDGSHFIFDQIIISTGHNFDQPDIIESNYFKSPWPIEKILPQPKAFYNFKIGLLGASLSAFDVATSLAHHHGKFIPNGSRLLYKRNPNAVQFKIIMHSAEGWLPHLQYEQKNPMRKIYRYISKEDLLGLLDENGKLRIRTYFDEVCRPVLRDSLSANGYHQLAGMLEDSAFDFEAFIDKMSDRHAYDNPFAGMAEEMVSAKLSVNKDIPIYWKEAMDDLMYTLNFHMELLPAEDQIFFHEKVMPFLLNVIAALPLPSAKILLALHDAGALDLIKGNIENITPLKQSTRISVKENDALKHYNYKVFIECGGDRKINLENFPFQSLVKNGSVRAPYAAFANGETGLGEHDDTIFKKNDTWYKILPGIDVDSSYRVVGRNGKANARIFDPTFTHIQGIRPYSYGLQACDATAKLLIDHFKVNIPEIK